MTGTRLAAWDPAVPGIREVLHATFPARTHAYPMHSHRAWTLLLVDDGIVRYRLHRNDHLATAADVTLLPPDVPHDGCAAGPEGFRKRVIYLDEHILDATQLDSAIDNPRRVSPNLRINIGELHRRLLDGSDTVASEVALETVLSSLRGHWQHPRPAGDRSGPISPVGERPAVQQLREMLDEYIADGWSLQDAATSLGCTRSALVHGFTRHVGMPPHRYLISRRLDRARTLLLAGHPPADVAVSVGFHDQAHLTRHFKRLVGWPPAAWAASNQRARTRPPT